MKQNMPLGDFLHFVYPKLPSSDTTTVIFDINCQKPVQAVPASVVNMGCRIILIHHIAAGKQFFEFFPGNLALWIRMIDRLVDSYGGYVLYKYTVFIHQKLPIL